ncbi:MAG: error-prone DNA polymerase [Planctomycetia bacterium]|nr:error-prone DNA polymerase [Planctomycetia bacterium]
MRYTELHCLTNFSFLRAASHPGELVERAAELGYAALAVTDRHSLAGVVRAHAAAREVNKEAPRLKLLIGTELRPSDAPPVVLLATDRAAYGRLTRLLTLGKSRAPKGECALTSADIAAYGEGLLACVFSEVGTDGIALPPTPRQLALYRDAFGDRAYLLAEAHRGPDDAAWFEQLKTLSRKSKVPLVAAGGVYYHAPERRPLQDVLTAVRLGRTVAECGTELFANAERHLHPLDELELLYEDLPGALTRSVEVAERCTFSLDELRYHYPKELCPEGTTPLAYLIERTWSGAAEYYPDGVPEKVRNLIEHELAIIKDLNYEAYFLTVWDLVRFARSRNILCQGRGSAANSAVCYCLGVTAVDPEKIDVLFERFISRERNEAPDIDIDFEHERREEVLQYLYDKYGRERAAMTAEVICYRSRSAAREVGKALGLTEERITAISKTLVDHHRNPTTTWQECCRDGGLDLQDRTTKQFITLVDELVGFPRHLSQHVGGMVMTEGLLCEMVPIENAAMPGRTVVEWNKDDLDELGILKVDCLALGMLTAIRKAFDLIRLHSGRDLTLANVPREDPTVYDMACEADTIGVFQIESRAQMSMLPRLKPRRFYDLVIEVSIVRPGPIQGDMVHPYLRRRAGLEPIDYPNEEIKKVLVKTLGVPIFQEQAMQLAVVAAGFTPGEADQLRRAMGAWRRTGVIDEFREKLLLGMRKKGLSEEFAQRVYQQLCGFGEYGFPESHAASFALLVYVSAWLKRHYPAAFCASLLNSQPMGFYAPAQLIRDAREHGVEIRPIDVNRSDRDMTLEPVAGWKHEFAVRLGMRLLQGLPRAAAEKIVAARRSGEFHSTHNLAARTGLNQATLTLLARGDALCSLERDRRAALWQTLPLKKGASQPLFAALASPETEASAPSVAALLQPTPFEEVLADYRTIGLSLKGHPVAFLRDELTRQHCVTGAKLTKLNDGLMVRVAGLVLLRQRPGTSRGITFVTLEDETGVINLVVFPNVWQRFREVARAAKVWLVDGALQKQERVIHVVASRLIDFTTTLGDVAAKSRDFH